MHSHSLLFWSIGGPSDCVQSGSANIHGTCMPIAVPQLSQRGILFIFEWGNEELDFLTNFYLYYSWWMPKRIMVTGSLVKCVSTGLTLARCQWNQSLQKFNAHGLIYWLNFCFINVTVGKTWLKNKSRFLPWKCLQKCVVQW